MLENFSRSWLLVKASGKVLLQDRELIFFPLFSALASLLLLASFAAPLIASDAFGNVFHGGLSHVEVLLFGCLFYLGQYLIVFFFNTALIGAAMIRLEGGDPTISDGLAIARSKFTSILGYALIAATVGIALRMIEERVGVIGKLISGSLGIAFSVATFLTVPVLVSRDVGPIEAINESAALLKKTLGQNIIGNAGMGLVFGLLYALLVFSGIAVFAAAVATTSAALFGVVLALIVLVILLALVHATLQGVYSAALYRFATAGGDTDSFPGTLLQSAFNGKS